MRLPAAFETDTTHIRHDRQTELNVIKEQNLNNLVSFGSFLQNWYVFGRFYLHMSEKSCTFAPEFKSALMKRTVILLFLLTAAICLKAHDTSMSTKDMNKLMFTAADSWLQHLVVLTQEQQGASNEWLEPVSNEQYPVN